MSSVDGLLADFTRFFPMSLASDAGRYLVFAGALEVKGCVLIFCEAQTWRRASPGAAR